MYLTQIKTNIVNFYLLKFAQQEFLELRLWPKMPIQSVHFRLEVFNNNQTSNLLIDKKENVARKVCVFVCGVQSKISTQLIHWATR